MAEICSAPLSAYITQKCNSMKKRKDGLYEMKVTINGKRVSVYGKTKAEALDKIRTYKEISENGRSFRDVAEEWWEEHSETLTPNSLKGYKPALFRACKHFDEKPIKYITSQEIAKFVRIFAQKGYAEKTVKNQLLVLRLIFRWAVENGECDINPAREISVPANLPKTKRTMPDPEDIERIKNSAGCRFGLFAIWLLYTGLRKGELLALRWEDVDLNAGVIHVTKSVYQDSAGVHVKAPKTASSFADVPILSALRKYIPDQKPTGLVFPENGALMHEGYFEKRWKEYCKDSGVSCTPHQLRHAYATMLFENGLPPEQARLLLRHAQISTTIDIYTDIRKSKEKEIFNAVKDFDIS